MIVSKNVLICSLVWPRTPPTASINVLIVHLNDFSYLVSISFFSLKGLYCIHQFWGGVASSTLLGTQGCPFLRKQPDGESLVLHIIFAGNIFHNHLQFNPTYGTKVINSGQHSELVNCSILNARLRSEGLKLSVKL